MEGLPVTGAWADPVAGLVGVVVLETGGSARLATLLSPGEPVVFMGPTGTPTDIPEKETVLLVGAGFGNAVIPSLASAMRERGNHVTAVAGFRTAADLFYAGRSKRATDRVVWCTEEGPLIEPARSGDRAARGTPVEGLAAWGAGTLDVAGPALARVDHLLTVGPDVLLAAVNAARRNGLGAHLGDARDGRGLDQRPDAVHDEGDLRPVPDPAH
jgi:NAD(P)H-flavin reductase